MTEQRSAEYVRTCASCGRAEAPDPIDLVRQLREALGMFSGAMAVSPKQAWAEALAVTRRLAGTREIDGGYGRDDFFEDREETERRRG